MELGMLGSEGEVVRKCVCVCLTVVLKNIKIT